MKSLIDRINRKISLLPILLPIFFDNLGFGIIIPVVAPIFLEVGGGIFPPAYTLAQRTIAFGFLIAAYPAAAFFGAPVLGDLSDRHGRKKMLSISLIGTAIGYLLIAVGVLAGNLWLLFAGRIIDGFTAGNTSIIYSAVADISSIKEKTRNFGLIGMAFGLGFILGPFIGGKLTEPQYGDLLTPPSRSIETVSVWVEKVRSGFEFVGNPVTNGVLGDTVDSITESVDVIPENKYYATPFWVAFGLTLINLLIVLWRFPETLIKKRKVRIKWWKGFSDVYEVFTMRRIRAIFVVIFLLSFGFNFFVQFFPVFLFQRFSFSPTQIGQLFAYIGLWLAFSQGVLIRPISKNVKPEKIVFFTILALAFALPTLLLPDKPLGIFLLAPLVGILQGLLQPSYIAVVSNMTDKRTQGRVLGLNQSVLFFAQIFPPLIAGVVVSIKLSMPIIVASAITFLAWLIYAYFFERIRSTSRVK